MKKVYYRLLAIMQILTILLMASSGLANASPGNKASDILLGDVNGDNRVTALDARLVLKAAAGLYDLGQNVRAGDVNGDGNITAADARYILMAAAGLKDLTQGGIQEHAYRIGVYGQSELGRDLTYYCFTPEQYSSTVLLNFAIHGFEDEYNADGQILVDTANSLIKYYDENPSLLGETQLIIIPCANPDGLYEGTTNNGFGRCNSNGIDLNRDFDANYSSNSNPRNYTPYAFSAAESRALRDLCYEYQPDIVLDLHGWLDETIGDAELAEVFYSEMGLSLAHTFTATNCKGYFSNWAHQQGALALLVEFKSSTEVPLDKLEATINRLLCGDYDNGTGEYALDERYKEFQGIQSYTLSQGQVTTYAGFNIPFGTVSYIDGANDLCTIDKIYQNGWVRVQYPVSSGTKTAYCPLEEFIDGSITVEPYLANVSANTKVYRTSSMSTSLGSVWNTDDFYVVADNGIQVQIIYPLDGGGWKMGWIEKEYLKQ